MRSRLLSSFVFISVSLLTNQSYSAAPASNIEKTSTVLPVENVLQRISKKANATQKSVSVAAQLIQDIVVYRKTSTSLSNEAASAKWLDLWDRCLAIDSTLLRGDYAALDPDSFQPISPSLLIAALPQPSVWPTINQQLAQRLRDKDNTPHLLSVYMISELLLNHQTGVKQIIQKFEKQAQQSNPENSQRLTAQLDYLNYQLASTYGTREQIVASFQKYYANELKASGSISVPDLVGLMGADKAEPLLTKILLSPTLVYIKEGDATKKLARKIALANISKLRKAQWSLIDTNGTSALYEAMQKRFDPVAKLVKASTEDEVNHDYAERRDEADAYYFVDMVIAGRFNEAELALSRASNNRSELHFSKEAVNALIRAGKSAALTDFLAKLLERKPQMQVWNLYIQQAAQAGRAKESLALIDRILTKKDLSAYLRESLWVKRLDALLSVDQTAAAMTGFKEILLKPIKQNDEGLEDKAALALRVAALGRILNEPEMVELGLDTAAQALKVFPKTERYSFSATRSGLMEELRRQGKLADVQRMALDKIEQNAQDAMAPDGMSLIVPNEEKRAALIELVAIYAEQKKYADVLRLVNEFGAWTASDVSELIDSKDSLGVPLGLLVGQALYQTGDRDSALKVVRALLVKKPAYDPAYQLLVDLNPDKLTEELDQMYTLDQFEERPLIWKATVLKAKGQLQDAEATVKRAIAVDPSDGEQGVNDRMRAYAVLADILEAKNDAANAKIYRNVVAAIRISEQSDEMYKLGLNERAVAGYRSALDKFSDAYCIQSRLAIQLGKLGQHNEALKHYEQAYTLMPDSFGRVESHCFGCESAFADSSAQLVAERVFTDLIKRGDHKPQAPYMLGYLRKEQGRYEEAVELFRNAVALDSQYLNAWKQLHELGEKTYIDSSERDIARMKLLSLDPMQRHVKYSLSEVADFSELWNAVQKNAPLNGNAGAVESYPFKQSVLDKKSAMEKLPPEMRMQMDQYLNISVRARNQSKVKAGSQVIAKHKLVKSMLNLSSPSRSNEFSEDYEE